MKQIARAKCPTTTIEYTPPFAETGIKEISDEKYVAKMVENSSELDAVLRLRFEVFKKELSTEKTSARGRDFDKYDLSCGHIIVTEIESRKVIGTYRLNTIEGAKNAEGFYAYNEFSIEDFPDNVLSESVELGRACIAKDHRNSRVLFLLWRVLARFLEENKKRYLFGCCSVFTQDGELAANILHQFKTKGHLHETISIKPREEKICIPRGFVPDNSEEIELPSLVNIYLRIGAKVCGEPAIDRDFKTIDYFVIFDLLEINRRYRKLFFS